MESSPHSVLVSRYCRAQKACGSRGLQPISPQGSLGGPFIQLWSCLAKRQHSGPGSCRSLHAVARRVGDNGSRRSLPCTPHCLTRCKGIALCYLAPTGFIPPHLAPLQTPPAPSHPGPILPNPAPSKPSPVSTHPTPSQPTRSHPIPSEITQSHPIVSSPTPSL